MPRLGLAAGAPPALAGVRLFDSQQVGPCRRVASQKLAVEAGEGLSHMTELGAAEVSSRRGLYRRPALTCSAIHSAVSRDTASVATLVMGEGGLIAVPLWNLFVWSATNGCNLRVLVGHLITAHPAVRRDSPDGDLIASCAES